MVIKPFASMCSSTRMFFIGVGVLLLSGCGNSSTAESGSDTENSQQQTQTGDSSANPSSGQNQSDEQRSPVGGHHSDPEFQWPAVAGAGNYRLIVIDHRGDRISQHVSAQQANCADSETACRFTPTIQIHDAILKWRTQAFDASNQWIATSEDSDFNTLRSLTAQPFTDLDNTNAPPNPGNGYPTIEFDQLLVLNNDWNAQSMYNGNWTQTVAVDRQVNGSAQITFEYDWLMQDDGDEYAVKSYPQVVYGNKLGAHVSGTAEELGVPATITALDEFEIRYRYTETGIAERNLAFESFFHTDCNIGGPNFTSDNREFELMVWIANPGTRTPGTIKAETGVMIDNQLWDVWIKPEQDDSYIAFTAVNETTQGTLHWNRFIDWTVSWSSANQSGVKSLDVSWCMAAIEFGVETWWGAARLQLNELSISRQ